MMMLYHIMHKDITHNKSSAQIQNQKNKSWGSKKKGAASSPVLDAGAGLHGLGLGGYLPNAAVNDLVEVHQGRSQSAAPASQN
jgi:hypothetical protein